MSVALLASLLNEFYSCELPYFPVIEAEPTPKVKGRRKKAPALGKLIGFLTRKDLDLWVSDLDRLGREHKRIPREILNQGLSPAELLKLLPAGQSIPVLNSEGAKVAFWNESELIQAMGQLPRQSSLERPPHPQATSEQGKLKLLSQGRNDCSPVSENSRWLGNLLLRALPWPLYACDLQGKTLFFNSSFEEQILRKAKIKNSLQRAEKYLMEIVRKLLAQSFMEDSQSRYPHAALSTYDHSLSHYIRIVNLEEEGHLHGYLLVFQESEDPGFINEVKRHLASGSSLDEIIDEIERRIIFNALGSNGKNISHTAKALGIKRSTLQNKIQRLKIEKRFGPIREGPIRRHRALQAKAERLALQKPRKKVKVAGIQKKSLSEKAILKQNKARVKKKTSSKVISKQKNMTKEVSNAPADAQNKKATMQKKQDSLGKSNSTLQKKVEKSIDKLEMQALEEAQSKGQNLEQKAKVSEPRPFIPEAQEEKKRNT